MHQQSMDVVKTAENRRNLKVLVLGKGCFQPDETAKKPIGLVIPQDLPVVGIGMRGLRGMPVSVSG